MFHKYDPEETEGEGVRREGRKSLDRQGYRETYRYETKGRKRLRKRGLHFSLLLGMPEGIGNPGSVAKIDDISQKSIIYNPKPKQGENWDGGGRKEGGLPVDYFSEVILKKFQRKIKRLDRKIRNPTSKILYQQGGRFR